MKEIITRIKELIIKVISVKGVFALTMTLLTLIQSYPPYLAFVAWLVFIFGREAFKYLQLIQNDNAGKTKP